MASMFGENQDLAAIRFGIVIKISHRDQMCASIGFCTRRGVIVQRVIWGKVGGLITTTSG